MKTRFLLAAFAGMALASSISAQTIRTTNEAYAERRILQMAPPPPGTAISAVAAAPVAPVQASIQLEKGVRVDQQLRAYGEKSGWMLVWEGPEYVLDQSIVVQGTFEESISAFLSGANEAGARLRAVSYRGNKTVRIMEY